MALPRRNIRFRHAAQLLVVLACLVWGGYQITDNASAQPGVAAAIVGQTDQAVHAEYPNLPLAVARSVSSVVAIQQVVDQTKQQGSVSSGVIINDQQILTAGHSVEAVDGLACSQTTIVATGLLSNATASKDLVTHASVRYGKSEDMAILTLHSSDNFKSLPDVAIADRQPEVGDAVYFINYQPTSDGKVRSPALQASSKPAADFSKPAIFSGIVLGSTKNGLAIATGHGQSFGQGVADVMVRKGASGGAIVNARGELVGLSVSSQSLVASKSASAISKEFHVQLSESSYQIAYMQVVGKGLVSSLQTSMISCDH